MLPVFLAVFGLAEISYRRWRWIGDAGLFAAFFLAVIVPWTIRNWQVHGRAVLVATNGGSTFYGGNNGRVLAEPRYWGYWLSTVELPHRELIEAVPDEVSHDGVEWRLGAEWLREHWEYIPLLGLFKLVRLWIWPPDFDAGYRLLRLVGYVPFWAAFSLGFLLSIRDRRYWTFPWVVIHAPVLATILTALVFWGCPRFRDVNVPSLMLYCVLALQDAGSGLKRWREPLLQRIRRRVPGNGS